ncbi:glycoside hydrolase superfamily [Cladochytrium replicatum]|nr:glycoside hydrolase superfamily [Cladochytrium replicatum]
MAHELQSLAVPSNAPPIPNHPPSTQKKQNPFTPRNWSRRRTCIVGVAAFVLVAAAVGVGVGVSLSNSTSRGDTGSGQWSPASNDFVFDGQGITIPPSNLAFVTRDANIGLLYEGSNIFRFVSVNMPDLTGIIDRTAYSGRATAPSLGAFIFPNVFEIDNALISVSQMSGRVVRPYCISYGASPRHYQGRGIYGEGAFRELDYVIARAGNLGVRVMVPLIDMWNWPAGGAFTFARLATPGRYTTVLAAQRAFFTDRDLIDEFKSFIGFIMNRTNTFNGLRYGDDPAVFGWQLGNELGGWNRDYGIGGGFQVAGSWVLEIAQHLKQNLRVKQLVIDGVLGGEDGTKWPSESLTSPNVDVITNHYYSGQDYVGRITRDGRTAARNKKALIATEYGLAADLNIEIQLANFVADPSLSSIAGSISVAGALYWSFRFQARDGGFYTHFESGTFYSYHWPGFDGSISNRVPTNGFNHVARLRDASLRATNQDPSRVPWPTPTPAPVILSSQSGRLRWAGSAGAYTYEIGKSTDRGSSFVSYANVSAGMVWRDDMAAMYTDAAVASSGTDDVQYQVRAVGRGGAASAWSRAVSASG